MPQPSYDTLTPLPALPARSADSHKGDYGRAVLIGGSRGMTGAIALAGLGCLRSGAGLVTLAIPELCLESVAAHEPSFMTSPLPCDEAGRLSVAAQEPLAELADAATCLACGPGLGRGQQLSDLVVWMYEVLPQPMVVDADALDALAQRSERLHEPAGPRILTPHSGEFSRLLGQEKLDREKAEIAAVQWASQHSAVIVLKGHQTAITDGKRAAHNSTGNAGMATGGTGDVLTGIITALVCQQLPPFEAARLGVFVHGLAGDLAAQEMGQTSLIASDVVRFLPAAFKQLEALGREADSQS